MTVRLDLHSAVRTGWQLARRVDLAAQMGQQVRRRLESLRLGRQTVHPLRAREHSKHLRLVQALRAERPPLRSRAHRPATL